MYTRKRGTRSGSFFFYGLVGDNVGGGDDAHLSNSCQAPCRTTVCAIFHLRSDQQPALGRFFYSWLRPCFVAKDERHGFGFDQAALFLPIDVEIAFLKYLEDLVFVSQVK